MKFYSESLNKLFDSEKELMKAENDAEKKALKEKAEKEKIAAERKVRAQEVEDARKAMVAAQHKYREVLEAFVKDYKSYHYTTTDIKDIPTLFDSFFDHWF